MMGYQTGTLTGIKTWRVERGIRDRIAVWYLFVEKESSVRSDLRRGREKLREVLREEYDFE